MKQVALALVLVGCGDDGVNTLPDAPPDAPIDAPFVCPPATGAGTNRSSGINAPETWTLAESPHIIRTDTSINAAVTIEPCSVVRIAGDRSINVRANGSLIAHGATDMPITFERSDPADSWATISALGGGTLSFTYATLTGGGDPLNTVVDIAGALDIAGNGTGTIPALHVEHVTISGSESQGINLRDGGGISPTSTDLIITGSAGAPIVTFARLVGTIPSGTYTGNTLNEIVIRGTGGNETINVDTTLRARGVPYRVGYLPNAVLDVASIPPAAPPTLMIEPGVTLKFLQTATMRIDASSGTTPAAGALSAVGTAAQPIIFTSAATSPAAGDWYGIWLGRQPLAATRIDHVQIHYAGRNSNSGQDSCIPTGQTDLTNDAAIRILGGIPSSVFITNTTIANTAQHGIDLGFRSDTKPNFLPTNNITVPHGSCRTTYPKDSNGSCPTSPPPPCN